MASITDDQVCLTKIVDALLEHREKQLSASKLKIALMLVELVAPIYSAYLADKAMTELGLRARLETCARELQLSIPAEWLERLVVPRTAFAACSRHKQGAKETARFLIGKLFDVSGSLLSLRKNEPPKDARFLGTAFGRAVSIGAAAAYSRQVLEWEPAEGSPERAVWLVACSIDTYQRSAIRSMATLYPTLAAKAAGGVPVDAPWPIDPAVHPMVRHGMARALDKGVRDGRWDAATEADDSLRDFIEDELAVFDGHTAVALCDAPDEAAASGPSSSRKKTKPARRRKSAASRHSKPSSERGHGRGASSKR